ncbi:MAG: protein BatD [Candidatus Omnitrophica bacterium]|nr:protein BatD [Candidatus Omnitrophota bacterium]
MAKRIFLIIFIGLLFSAKLVWAEIQFSAEVDHNTIGLDSYIQLSLNVSGAQDVAPLTIAMDGFDVKYLGPSRRVSIVNGQYSSSVSLNYALYPKKVGSFEVPALTIEADGKKFTSPEIKVNVVAGGESGTAGAAAPIQNLEDKLFLVQQLEKKEVYVGEKTKIQLALFVSDLQVRDIQYPKMEADGVEFEDYAEPKQTQQIVNGVRYNVVLFDRYFYPKRSGDIVFKPATAGCQMLIAKRNNKNVPGQFGTMFDQDFLNDFFDLQEKRPMTVTSKEITLKVKDLPQENKPEKFSGGVGNFVFDISVAPQQVKVGDPLTIKMSITGEGNLRDVKFPDFADIADLKVYDPIIKLQGNAKNLEQVLIVKNKNFQEIPAVKFYYFDPTEETYKTIVKGPFKLSVLPPDESEQPKVVAYDNQVKTIEPEKLGEDILFIKDQVGELHPTGKRFYHHWMFYLMWLLILSVWGGAYFYYSLNMRLKTDTKFAKSLKAPRHAKQGFAKAAQYLEQQKVKEFYDVLFETLALYMANKFDLPVGEISSAKLNERFKNNESWQSVAWDLANIFEECDAVRFAQANISVQRMQESYLKAEKIIDHLERVWR